MYRAEPIKGDAPLEQGDLCREVPIPLVSDTTKFADHRTKEFFQESVPTQEVLDSRSHLTAVIPVVRCHVLVLSQSCDLEDAEKDSNARFLVAPVLADDEDRFAQRYAVAVEKSGEGFAKKVAAYVTNPEQADKAAAKVKETIHSARMKALTDLWGGAVEGAFPLAACSDIGLRRSVCYFDNVISLPATWIPLLKHQRVLRLKNEWSEVLREKLSDWIGRYAFPGSKKDRWRVGGLVEEPEVKPPASKPPNESPV